MKLNQIDSAEFTGLAATSPMDDPGNIRSDGASLELPWVLSGQPNENASLQCVAITSNPFTIGRTADNELCIANILHFGNAMFTLQRARQQMPNATVMTDVADEALARRFHTPAGSRRFLACMAELLDCGQAAPFPPAGRWSFELSGPCIMHG